MEILVVTELFELFKTLLSSTSQLFSDLIFTFNSTGVEPDLGLGGGKGASGDDDNNTGGGGGGIFLVLTSVDPNVYLLVSGFGSGTLE